MFDPELVASWLHQASSEPTARARRQHIRPLRGVRGVPHAQLTRLLVRAWASQRPTLPDDVDGLHHAFCTAFEDGLLAVGLLAALLPDHPHAALDLCERWLAMVDDVETADALGWLVLGPALLCAGEPVGPTLRGELGQAAPFRRRAAVLAGLALLPEPVTGPAAAALRERMGQRAVAFVDAPLSEAVREVMDQASRDADPHVRKALVRLARAWGEHDPEACGAWLEAQRGGVWRLLREEAARGMARGKRKRLV